MFEKNFLGEGRGPEQRLRELERKWGADPSPELFVQLCTIYLRAGRSEEPEALLKRYYESLGLTSIQMENRSISRIAVEKIPSVAKDFLFGIDNPFGFSVDSSVSQIDEFSQENPGIAVGIVLQSKDWETFLNLSEKSRRSVKKVLLNTKDKNFVESFLSDPVISQLSTVSFNGVALGDYLCELLEKSPYIKNWKDVWLAHNKIGSDGIKQLAKSENIRDWRRIGFTNNPIGADGVKALVDSGYVNDWKRVDLLMCDLGDDGAEVLAVSDAVRNWETVGLDDNNITLKGLARLVSSPNVAGWQKVQMTANPCSNTEGEKLVQESKYTKEGEWVLIYDWSSKK